MNDPIAYLRRLHRSDSHNDAKQMIRDRDSVIARYRPIFSNPVDLTDDDFAGFLRFENNRHWWGLHRAEARMVRHMDILRIAIGDLMDESRPIADRIDGMPNVPGFTQQIFTPILLVTHPDSCGVWNAISESAMRRLGLWPDLAGASTLGERYTEINDMLQVVAVDLGVDLWTLDVLWWVAEKEHDPTKHFIISGARAPRRVTTPPRGTTRPVTKRPEPAAEDTFVCESCWQTKLIRLASDTPNICIDCV